MFYTIDEFIMHFGVGPDDNPPGRGSGRYPKGSGENPYQHPDTFLDRYNAYVAQGLTEREIAAEMKLKGSSELRAEVSIAKNEIKNRKKATAVELRDSGLNTYQIADRMGEAEATVRGWLKEDTKAKSTVAQTTANFLKEVVDKKGMVDVTSGGTELVLGNVSSEKLNQATHMLELQGYKIYKGRVPNATNPDVYTTTTVLCKPGTEYKEIFNWENVHSIIDYDKELVNDGREVQPKFTYPKSLDSKRLQVIYAEDGGKKKDGVVELRPGVEDISLGNSHYAQVRILVDGTHYIKGMAMYSNDLPPGIDVRFNTNKPKGTPVMGPKGNTVLKPIVPKEKDPDNPFGSLIKEGGQRWYTDKNGEKQLSVINKRADEGDWGGWSDKVPSQFLAKQPINIVKKQLKLSIEDAEKEYRDIMLLTNPTVKKKLLMNFADQCDRAAVDLKASPFPSQKYKVILPLTSIKSNEVYAPSYENGEQLALIRYPHAGKFEIPIVTVNNKNKEGRSVMGDSPEDAVGISVETASQLSGADFDGDCVMVIPLKSVPVSAQPHLEGLKNFDPEVEYGGKEPGTFKAMTKKNTQREMGMISNLITDMTIKKASIEEIERAVKHSMVVIDAEKHGYDYKLSEYKNGIKELRKNYMGHIDSDGKYSTGASTLISAAKSVVYAPKTQGSPRINQKGKAWYDPTKPEGAYIYKEKEPEYDKNGKLIPSKRESTRMQETSDAFTLVSEARAPVELEYAMFANKLKQLALDSRREAVYTPRLEYSKSARLIYANEVEALKSQLVLAKLNKPREREAQRRTASFIERYRRALEDQGYSSEEIKKEIKDVRTRKLAEYRSEVNAKRNSIEISDRQWEAIQAGAVADSVLSEILLYANPDRVRELATPTQQITITPAKEARIRNLLASNYTTKQIADAVGLSVSTITRFIHDEKQESGE